MPAKSLKLKSSCADCGGKGYKLSNVKGWVRAQFCACFRCPHCSGDGRIYTQDETGASYMRACDCAIKKKHLQQLNLAGIPGKYADTSFATYNKPPYHPTQIKAKTRAEHFVDDFGKKSPKGIVFMGAPGVGKTHLAVSIIKALVLDKGVDCKFVDFFQLLSDIRHGFSQDLSEQALINPYIHSKVLVIDELAKGRNTEWELTILDQIISSRYNQADRVTIFTTNYMNEPPKDRKKDSPPVGNGLIDLNKQNFSDMLTRQILQEKVGPRIYSRLAEMCDFVTIEGQDHRQA